MSVLGKAAISVIRAMAWSSLIGGAITAMVWLRTSPEFPLGVRLIATWFGLFFALALVPSLALELGVTHLLLAFEAEGTDEHGSASPPGTRGKKGASRTDGF